MLDDMVGKLFWCIRPIETCQMDGYLGPSEPWYGKLFRLEKTCFRLQVYCTTTNTCTEESIFLFEETSGLFLTHKEACIEYIIEREDFLSWKRDSLEAAETKLQNFIKKFE